MGRMVVGEPIESMTFEQVYRAHFAFVWRSLRRLGVGEDDAGDAAQEVFMVVHRKLPEFAGRSKLTTWLYGVCFRVASERRRARKPIQIDPHDAALMFDRAIDPGTAAEHKEGLALLEQVLNHLPTEQRAVFCLFEFEGMTGEQIAECLEIPLGTVYSRLRLARAAFDVAATRLLPERERPAAAWGTGG